MQVFFDYQAFEMQRIGGISRSYVELISHLRDEECDCVVGIKESDNVYLREKGLAPRIKPLHYRHNLIFEGRKLYKGQRTLTRKVLERCGYKDDFRQVNKDYCIKLLKRQQFDVFEPTYFDAYFLSYLKGKPFVLTVHDMIPELLDVDKTQAEQKRLLCPMATHIHVPSLNTKNDLVRIMDIPSERITVIPHGAPAVPPQRKPMFSFPYVLYVGARWSYKNFSPFIAECAHVIARYLDFHVVCTGEAFSAEEMKLFSDLGISERVVSMAHASEEELQALYQHAFAFVYPSAYEGFGMPILEAFVNDCPVMLNNASCFPEIGGDAAVYFDINKEGDLCEKINSLYSSGTDLRKERIQKGRAQAKKYSWEKSAELLKEIYGMLV